MRDITVAAVNFQPEFGQIEKNLDKVEAWSQKLTAQGAEIICFPEMSLCGYDRTSAVDAFSQPVPGPATERLVAIAAQFKVTLLAGLAEIGTEGGRFISQVVATPTGLSGLYRKTHLNQPEKEIFEPGQDIGVFEHGHCTFGLQLCYDAHFPELSTLQVLAGAEILFVASASPRDNPSPKKARMLRYLPARAYDNSCYVVACNLVGPGPRGQTFAGVAMIISPKGELLRACAGWTEQAVIAPLAGSEIERLRQTRMGYFLAHRRPDLYKRLSERPEILPSHS